MSEQISHMLYHCPGIHDKGNRQLIEPMKMCNLLARDDLIEIPIFQRRFVWNEKLIAEWFRDCNVQKPHRVGKLLFARRNDIQKTLLCIDGQQRLTVTMIFLAALCAQGGAESSKAAAVLFNKSGMCRLRPSLADREPFDRVIQCARTPDLAKTLRSDSSLQEQAFLIFQRLLRRCSVSVEQVLSPNLMRVELLGSPPLAQVFVWAQERSVLAEGLIQNPQPGHCLSAMDLARNLMLAPILQLPHAEQEAAMMMRWLQPIEMRVGISDEFLQRFCDSMPEFPETAFQKQLQQMEALMGRTAKNLPTMHLYARFVALAESQSDILNDLVEFVKRCP